MVSASFTVKRNDTKILLLSLFWVIPPILAMSDSSVVINGIVFTGYKCNTTRSGARKFCENMNARLPLYFSTEIQTEVVRVLDNHWIALKKQNTLWEWRTRELPAEESGRWKRNGTDKRAITEGQTHWMQVKPSSSHPVVCEGVSEEGVTNSADVTVNGTVFRLYDNATFSEAKDICKSNSARLPQYISAEIQGKVVNAFGNHWIGLERTSKGWKWQKTVLPANMSNKQNRTNDGNRAITAGGRHWINVKGDTGHRVVCEGGSGYETTPEAAISDCTVIATEPTHGPSSAATTETTETTPPTAVTTTTTTTTSETTTTIANDSTLSEARVDTDTTTTAIHTTRTDTDITTTAGNTTSTDTDITTTAGDTTSTDTGTTRTDTGTTRTDSGTTSTDTDTNHSAADTTSTDTGTTRTDTDITATVGDTTSTDTDTTITDTDTTSTDTDTTSSAADTTSTDTGTTRTDTDTTSSASDSTLSETTVEPLGVDRMGRKIFKKCTCRCRNLKATPSEPEAVAAKVTELKKNASVNSKNMIKSVLKTTSRMDKRSSPAVISSGCLILVAIPFMAVVFGDILTVMKWFCVQNKVKPICLVSDSP